MKSYNILGDYVAADFLPLSESRIEVQMPFSGITEIVLQERNSPEEDYSAVKAYLEPLFANEADFLLIDLQDTGMLADPEGEEPDALRCSRARWKDVIKAVSQEILAVYLPEQIIVNEHYSSTVYLEGEAFHTYENSARISRYNMLMRFLFAEIEKAAQGCHIIPFPAEVFDVCILWEGEKEFQYHPCYYRYGQQAAQAILSTLASGEEPGETSAVHEQEENRIAIAREHCGEVMSWLAGAPALAAEEDLAERRRIRDLRIEASGDSWVKLAWTENIYAPAYLIERYENGAWEQVNLDDAVTEPWCRFDGLEAGKEYYFRVNVQTEDAMRRFGQDIICRIKKDNY